MFNRHILDNGLVLLIEKRPSDVIAMMAGFRTGSKYDTKRYEGITHFLEHMLFGGTKKYPGNAQVKKEIGKYGGYLNAWTGPHRMRIGGEMLNKNFGKLFDIEKEMIRNPLIRKKDVENEKGIVLDELHRMYDSYDRAFYYKIKENMFKKGPCTNTLGTEKTIKSMSNENLKKWLKTILVPENMIISVVGNINDKNILKKVEKTYGGLKKKKAPELDIKINRPKELVAKREKAKEAKIDVSVISPNQGNKDVFAFELLINYLKRKMFDEARTKRGLTYGIGGYFEESDVESIGSLMASCSVKNLDPIRKIMENEIEKVIKGKIDSKELTRNKKTNRYNEVVKGERTFTQARRGFDYERLHISNLFGKYSDYIDKVTPKQLVNVANKYFDEDKQYWTAMKPVK